MTPTYKSSADLHPNYATVNCLGNDNHGFLMNPNISDSENEDHDDNYTGLEDEQVIKNKTVVGFFQQRSFSPPFKV